MKYSVLTIAIMFVVGLLIETCSNFLTKTEVVTAPKAVTAPKVIDDTSVTGKVTVTATIPIDLGKKSDGTAINAEEIKYELYYARYGHSKNSITVDGGTPIEDIKNIADMEKEAGFIANKDAGIVIIKGNTALTTGFVISNLLEDVIYRYFIRSIHPDDANKYTDTATRLAFVLKPRTVKVIPHGKTSIQYERYLPELTHVFIPDSVTSIGKGAFSGNKLTRVSIPDSVTSVGNDAFANNSLTRMSIPDSVTSIGEYAFADNKLTNVSIPDSVTSIGDGAFYDNALTSVSIPDSVTSIGASAFANNALTSVSIPDSVTILGASAFANNALTNVTLSEKLYNKIKDAGNLNTVFGDKVTHIKIIPTSS